MFTKQNVLSNIAPFGEDRIIYLKDNWLVLDSLDPITKQTDDKGLYTVMYKDGSKYIKFRVSVEMYEDEIFWDYTETLIKAKMNAMNY